MNREGRPQNTSGSVYRRGDSAIWWMRYRDNQGRRKQQSTGARKREEAEKILRKVVYERDQGLLPALEVDLPAGNVEGLGRVRYHRARRYSQNVTATPSVKFDVEPGFSSRNHDWKFHVSPASTGIALSTGVSWYCP